MDYLCLNVFSKVEHYIDSGMILKILLTAVIVIAVYSWFKYPRHQSGSVNAARVKNKPVAQTLVTNTWVKPFSYALGGLSVCVGVLIFYLSWQADHVQYQVTITHPQTGDRQSFIAIKKNMRGRLFITESGREIWVSDLDRIEIKQLDAGND